MPRTLLRCDPEQAGADPFLTSRADGSVGGSTESNDEDTGRCLQRLLSFVRRRKQQLGESPLRPRRAVGAGPPGTAGPINDAIRVPRVRLIDEDGAQVGIKPTDEALRVRVRQGSRPRRGRRAGRPAGRAGHGLREVPLRAGAEGEARAQAPVPDQRQGDQAQAEDRASTTTRPRRATSCASSTSGRRSRSRSCSAGARRRTRSAGATC